MFDKQKCVTFLMLGMLFAPHALAQDVDLDLSGEDHVIDIASSIGSSNPNNWDDLEVRVEGFGSLTINHNSGSSSDSPGLFGTFDMSDFDGDFTLHAADTLRGWGTYRLSVFAQGNNTINNGVGSVMGFSVQDSAFINIGGYGLQTTTLQFQDGEDVFNNAGTLGPHDVFGGRWTFGGMVGYVRARIKFDAHPNTANFEGMHAGLYSNYAIGSFFANLAVNQTWLDMDNNVPALNLTPEGTVLGTDVESLGGQFEAGWRFRLDRLEVEPLASISVVKSDFEDINVSSADPSRFGGNVQYRDPESLRAGLGVRLAMRNILPSIAPIDARLTTKVLNESEGESSASIENVGPMDALVSDTFDGTFTEVSGGVSISNARKTVSGFLDVDAAFGDDYDSLGLSAGVRVQW